MCSTEEYLQPRTEVLQGRRTSSSGTAKRELSIFNQETHKLPLLHTRMHTRAHTHTHGAKITERCIQSHTCNILTLEKKEKKKRRRRVFCFIFPTQSGKRTDGAKNASCCWTRRADQQSIKLPMGPQHTSSPSITHLHLPPNSARTGCATEGALFTSAQLSTDAVSALRKVWVLIRLWEQHSHEACMET